MVLVILGDGQNAVIDERLKEIAPQLQKKDPTLVGFTVHKTVSKSIRMGETVEIDLVGKNVVSVTIHEKPDDGGRLTLTIKPPKVDELQYACTCGKFFPILTNVYTPEKQRLIIAVMAKPCKKK